MDNEILENHKKYLERNALYKSFGYDIEKERTFILEQGKPFYGKILEAGTGKGHFALALAKAGYSFVTFDISDDEQRFAKLNIAHFGFEKQVDFKIENGERTSFLDSGFDVIFSVNVLHHLRNPYQVIDEFIRILSPKGKLILADFTKEGFKVMDKIHSLEGNTHEIGKVGLANAELYLIKKGFSVKQATSVYQCVLIAEKGGI
ncbi:MAG: class I SAM-dependent methyltransferase [Candidatus Omnitrophota bacterium]